MVFDILPSFLALRITHGTLIDLATTALLAHIAYVKLARAHDRAEERGPILRTARWAVPFLMLLGGLVLAFKVSDTEQWRQFRQTFGSSTASYQSLIFDPHNKIMMETLRKNFPEDFQRIVDAYAKEAEATMGNDPSRGPWPAFPLPPIYDLIRSHSADMARAPDANLIAIARTTHAYFAWLKKEGAPCGMATSESAMKQIQWIGERPDAEKWPILGAMIVAGLDAARAGMDRPVERQDDAKRTARLDAALASVIPPEIPALMDGCSVQQRLYPWIESLPENDRVYFLSRLYVREARASEAAPSLAP